MLASAALEGKLRTLSMVTHGRHANAVWKDAIKKMVGETPQICSTQAAQIRMNRKGLAAAALMCFWSSQNSSPSRLDRSS